MSTRCRNKTSRRAHRQQPMLGGRFVLRLHRDERGSMSLISLFSLLLLTILLGMVINSSRQVESKVRLQNVADASTYSGGVALARGMNSLAFTNHMLSDVFALTAFLREARDGNAQSFTPDILAAWSNIGPVLSQADFPKFAALGDAIPEKVQLEQEMIFKYRDWVASISSMILPTFETILAEEAIPQYQRAVLLGAPLQAQMASGEMALRNSSRLSARDQQRGPISAVLWRTSALPVGGDVETVNPTLPVIDPQSESAPPQIRTAARRRRDQLASRYLSDWNNQYMAPFDAEAKMSQFGRLWRGFTCGYLNQLLTVEYPNTNLPMMIRPLPEPVKYGQPSAMNSVAIDSDYMFVGVAYWTNLTEAMPGYFRNPMQADSQAFAQGTLFLPTRRLVYGHIESSSFLFWHPTVGRQGNPSNWDLWNQNWTFQIVPATTDSLPTILSQDPSTWGIPTIAQRRYQPPNFVGMTGQQMRAVNSH